MAAADLSVELRCPICLEIYKDPVTLPCGHSFCLLCIDRHFVDDIEKKCPVCNQKYRKIRLKKNVKLLNIVEAYRQQQQREEDQEKYRAELQEVVKRLSSRKESYNTILEGKLDYIRHFQKNADGISETIRTLFKDIQKQMKKLEHKVLGAISNWCDQATESVYDMVLKLEAWKDELDKKIQQCLDVMEAGTRDYSDIIERLPIVDTRTLGEKTGHLELGLISEILYTGLSDLIAGTYIEEPMNIYLDIEAFHEQMCEDLRSSCQVPTIWNLHPQVLSTHSIYHGQDSWEVDSDSSGVWRVGVHYSSMKSCANQFSIGNNNRSWCLRRYKNEYSVMHDNNEEQIQSVGSCSRLRMHLDYDAGQLSFYELSDPIRHLYTFTTTFSEPLHAAFCVWRNVSEGYWMNMVKL